MSDKRPSSPRGPKKGGVNKVEGAYLRSDSNFVSMKMGNEAKLAEEQREQERRRNLMVLILGYLNENGYYDAVDRLQQESGCSLTKFAVADNVDLMNVFKDYEEYYEFRFQKKPKLVRKSAGDSSTSTSNRASSAPRTAKPKPHIPPTRLSSTPKNAAASIANEYASVDTPPPKPKSKPPPPEPEKPGEGVSITGVSIQKPQQQSEKKIDGRRMMLEQDPGLQTDDYFDTRLLRPLQTFSSNPELRALAQQIQGEIYQENPNVRWSDVIGLDGAKRLLKEAVVMPIKYPQLFQGILSPWKGILLYGPPGTGKTLLAKAVATECRTTFFNIKASSIVSKWRGDSEKLVRVLFELARFHSPSTIFIDELDALIGQRGGDGMEHEGSRRMKTELLIQMDGLNNDMAARVFVLGASNLPWDLDAAMLRRLEKRILVGLPDMPTRLSMFHQNLPVDRTDGSLQYEQYATKTEGYSGADVKAVCKEAHMWPVRRLMAQLEALELDGQTPQQIESKVKLDAVTAADVEQALKTTRPTAQRFLDKYKTWEEEYGAS
ncbi:putative Vacuolar protein sorting-associated protein 4A [Blattamonas nauphoetae]|uniref:Katanin p60 ATPase-containing subunit A-like 2 n=1 Tax=Blattamonas nauphoetae TaxID=2049346 RepID=A0ABQ9Y6I9_9EUKA|nr:putative Vacuolar protein sorting-associated protein 4A [Blattamonas nauphoetae]